MCPPYGLESECVLNFSSHIPSPSSSCCSTSSSSSSSKNSSSSSSASSSPPSPPSPTCSPSVVGSSVTGGGGGVGGGTLQQRRCHCRKMPQLPHAIRTIIKKLQLHEITQNGLFITPPQKACLFSLVGLTQHPDPVHYLYLLGQLSLNHRQGESQTGVKKSTFSYGTAQN